MSDSHCKPLNTVNQLESLGVEKLRTGTGHIAANEDVASLQWVITLPDNIHCLITACLSRPTKPSSICFVNMPSGSTFLQFWLTEAIRNTFLSCVPKDDLASLRLGCHDFGIRAAPFLFEDIKINFRPGIFTKPVRMAALDRIGSQVQKFHFNLPHSDETFLNALVDRATGEEIPFIYEPYVPSSTHDASRLSVPTYGSWELTDILGKQYSPLFHAAANVPSFIRVFAALTKLKHLTISCPGQQPRESYRRSIVDYALISLRIAVERSKLPALDSLSLISVHPFAALYLNPTMGFGARPDALKRWKQIRNLTIHMDNPPTTTAPDHLKILQSYLQVFASTLTEFRFRWEGAESPCPLSLATEPCLQGESPRLACPKTYHLAPKPLRFPRVEYVEVENTIVDASQISTFLTKHRRTIRRMAKFQMDLEKTKIRTGTWDEALEPLTRICGSDKWKETSEEFMDVPLALSPVDFPQERVVTAWNDHLKAARSSKPSHIGFHRAGARTREFLLGKEDHMRKLFRASVFSCWR